MNATERRLLGKQAVGEWAASSLRPGHWQVLAGQHRYVLVQ